MASEFLTSIQGIFSTVTLVADAQGILIILLGLFIGVVGLLAIYHLAVNGFVSIAARLGGRKRGGRA
jgi:hypothetical protein